MRYVICYDVVDDRRRSKLAKHLLRHGDRVQWSTFECEFQKHYQLELALTKAGELIDTFTDSLRCYRICAECCTCIACIGTGTTFETVPAATIV